MQKIKKFFIAIILMVSVFAFVGCDDDGSGGGSLKPTGLDEGITYGVSFDTGIEGVKIPTQSVANGGFASEPSEIYREGYEFGGWLLDDDYRWLFNSDRVYASIILKAKWVQSEEDWFITEGVELIYDAGLNGIVVNGYTGTEANVVIPRFAKVNNYLGEVKKIADYAFSGNASIISITLPNTVETVGSYAFYGSTLQSISVADGGELTLGDYAFSALNLNSLVMPDSVTTLGDGCFMGSRLKSVSFGSGSKLTRISTNSFYRNDISVLKLPKSVKYIGTQAFKLNPLKVVILPSVVEVVGDDIFDVSYEFDTVYFSGDTLPVKGNGFSKNAYPEYMAECAYSSFDRGGRYWYYGADGLPVFYTNVKTQFVDMELLGLSAGDWSHVRVKIYAKYQVNSEVWGFEEMYLGAMNSNILSFDIDIYKFTAFEIYAYIDDKAYATSPVGSGDDCFKTEEIATK